MLLALIPRVGLVLVQSGPQPPFLLNARPADGERYLALARHLDQQGVFAYKDGRPTAADMPGYPLFLAGILRLGGDLLWVGLAQALLSCAGVALVWYLARRRFSPRAGWWAALLAALDPLGLMFVPLPLSETLYSFCAVAFLALLPLAKDGPGRGLAAGLAGGAAALVRPLLGGFALLAGLWLCLRPGRRWQGLMLLAGLAAALSPWMIRNALTMGHFIPLTTRGGFELYMGNAPDSNGGRGGHLVWGRDVTPPPPAPPGQDEVAQDRALTSQTWGALIQDPWRALSRLPAKFGNMWRPTWEGSSWRNWLALGGWYLVAAALALLGLWRGSRAGSGLLWAYVAYHVAVHLLVFGIIRYRVPVHPALAVLAAWGICSLSRLKSR